MTAEFAITIEPYFILANLTPLGLKRNNDKTTLTFWRRNYFFKFNTPCI
jgi:hypothetical protein